jgi:CxxC motif-containing protein (DUF1111 family)
MVSRFLICLSLLVALPALADAPTRATLGINAAAGWALFKRPWISAPSSLRGGGGLGPLYDARSCDSCHLGGGAGQVGEGAIGNGMVVRVGTADGGHDPVYGSQIQTLALPGFDAEADVELQWSALHDLRTITIDFKQMHYGAFAPQTRTALRRAPSLLGIGQLETIPESEILAQAKRNGGRPSWLTDKSGQRRLGRYGWKATEAQIADQVETAFQRDFGISSAGHPGPYGECTEAEHACRTAPGENVELPDVFRDRIVDFLRVLQQPDPRDETSAGFAIFRKIGCADCHATLTGNAGKPVVAYTDLLLHDLGNDLSDGIAEGDAKPSEWRTAPLWNIPEELEKGGLLHDGRARDVGEAVQWHGGEASRSRTAFNALSSNDRTRLGDFLLGR